MNDICKKCKSQMDVAEVKPLTLSDGVALTLYCPSCGRVDKQWEWPETPQPTGKLAEKPKDLLDIIRDWQARHAPKIETKRLKVDIHE